MAYAGELLPNSRLLRQVASLQGAGAMRTRGEGVDAALNFLVEDADFPTIQLHFHGQAGRRSGRRTMATANKTGMPELRVRLGVWINHSEAPWVVRTDIRAPLSCHAGGGDMGFVHREHHSEACLWNSGWRSRGDDSVP